MIEYRRIRIADIEGLVDLAISSLPDSPCRVSREKILGWVSLFCTVPGHFQMAAFKDGKPVAGLAAYVAEMPFHERCEATVMFCFSTVPGAGLHLLRSLMRWVQDHMNIRRLTWAMNPGFDERIGRLAARLGFQSSFPVLTYHKG